MDKKIRQKMLVARDLLHKGKYREAYKIICEIDHPTAKLWEKKLARNYPELLDKRSWSSLRLPVLGILSILLLVMLFVIVQDNTTKDGNFDYRLSQMALEEYCLMQGEISNCPLWTSQQLDTNRALVDKCRNRHDAFSNWRAFGVCLSSR